MKVVKRHLTLVLLSLALAGCVSTPLQVTPQQKPNQIITYNHGVPICTLLKKNGEKGGVAIWHAGGYRAALLGITYTNTTKSVCDFGIENISATDGQGKPLHIYTADELRRIAAGQYNAMVVSSAISGAAQGISAAMPSTTTYTGYGGYSGVATTYNPAQGAIANQAIQVNTGNAISNAGALLNSRMSLVDQILARTTVPPNGSVMGFVDVKKAPVINLRINANGEDLTATFNVQ